MNQNPLNRPIGEIKEELEQRIAKCDIVISGLEKNAAFNQVLSDFENQRKMIDDNWHWVTDKTKLEEMRVTKLAVLSLLHTIDNYKSDKARCKAELVKIDNPEDLVNKDYDGE